MLETGLVGFVVLVAGHASRRLVRRQVDKVPLPPRGPDEIADTSAGVARKSRSATRRSW